MSYLRAKVYCRGCGKGITTIQSYALRGEVKCPRCLTSHPIEPSHYETMRPRPRRGPVWLADRDDDGA